MTCGHHWSSDLLTEVTGGILERPSTDGPTGCRTVSGFCLPIAKSALVGVLSVAWRVGDGDGLRTQETGQDSRGVRAAFLVMRPGVGFGVDNGASGRALKGGWHS